MFIIQITYNMLFGYSIKNLQRYLDSLPDSTTQITIDYNLLSLYYRCRPLSVTLYNGNEIIYDMTRFTKLQSFTYALHGIHYTFIYSCLFGLIVQDVSHGDNYFPIFKFNPNAPLVEIRMPHFCWTQYGHTTSEIHKNCNQVKYLQVKCIDNLLDGLTRERPNMWPDLNRFPKDMEILHLSEPINDPEVYTDLFKLFKDRITLISHGIYEIKPNLTAN